MADETFPLRIQLKRKTTAQWASQNPVLLKGEPGIEVLSDGSEKIKYGDGVKTWSALSYAAGGGSGPALSSAAPQALGASAAPGTSFDASRADHVHPRPNASQVGADASGAAAAAVAAHEAAADPHPGYLTAAEGNAAYATAAQGALAASAIQPGNPALSDSREWSAETINQVEAEAGIATTRRAFTALRVFQSIASWWNGSAAKTKLDGIAAGATANSTDVQLRDRSTHSGTQGVGTISGLGGAATLNVGTTAGTVAAGDDSRLSNTRTPTDGSVTDQKIDTNGLSASSINWVAMTAWAPSTSYAKGALVEYLGVAYRRSAAGTSGATFTLANWQQVSPTSFVADQLPIVTTTARGVVPALGFSAITYAATTNLDLAALDQQFRTLTLSGDVVFTTSNLANGRMVSIRILPGASQRAFTFPVGWDFLGPTGSKPATIAANKTAVLSLTFYGSTDDDCVAAYSVQG